jgi:hypothetical protein
LKLPRDDKDMMENLRKHVGRNKVSNNSDDDKLVKINYIKIVKETDRARCIMLDNYSNKWIPKSVITDIDSINKTFTIKQWFAKEHKDICNIETEFVSNNDNSTLLCPQCHNTEVTISFSNKFKGMKKAYCNSCGNRFLIPMVKKLQIPNNF